MCPDTSKVLHAICEIQNSVRDVENDELRQKLLDLTQKATDAVYDLADKMDCE